MLKVMIESDALTACGSHELARNSQGFAIVDQIVYLDGLLLALAERLERDLEYTDGRRQRTTLVLRPYIGISEDDMREQLEAAGVDIDEA